jgi:hypothetical protein
LDPEILKRERVARPRLGVVWLVSSLASFGGLGCALSHNLRYVPNEAETPRAPFRTPYVLAVMEPFDQRGRSSESARTIDGAAYVRLSNDQLRFLPSDVADALVSHFTFTGLFKNVVRETPYERAHLLLSSELERFRVYARADTLATTRAAIDAAEAAGKPAPPTPPIATLCEMKLRLSLWRVDRRAPVWTREISLIEGRAYRGDLKAVTGFAFRDAMKHVVGEVTKALEPHQNPPRRADTGPSSREGAS